MVRDWGVARTEHPGHRATGEDPEISVAALRTGEMGAETRNE